MTILNKVICLVIFFAIGLVSAFNFPVAPAPKPAPNQPTPSAPISFQPSPQRIPQPQIQPTIQAQLPIPVKKPTPAPPAKRDSKPKNQALAPKRSEKPQAVVKTQNQQAKPARRQQPQRDKKPSFVPQPQPAKPIIQPVVAKPSPFKPVVASPVQPKIEQSVKPIPPAGDFSLTNNLVMILDPKKDESFENGRSDVTQQAIIAMYEKTTPVIMTSNIFEIIIKTKQQLGDQNLQQLRNANMNQLFAQANHLQQARQVHMQNIPIILLSNIDFDSKNWNCYFHQAENLVLLIPKEYIHTNIPKALNFNVNDQAKACGFNPTILTSVTDLSNNNLIQQIQEQKAKAIDEANFIAHLTSVFTIQKKNDELLSPLQNSKWLIYIVGHGGPAHMTIGSAREQLAMMIRHLAHPQSVQIFDQMRRPIPTPIIRAHVQEYEKMVEGRSEWANTQLVPESAQIAGISAAAFAQLMKFFDTSLDMAYVHYVTCFAGGANQTFVNETLSDLEVKFIVSTEGIHEGYTRGEFGLSTRSDRPGVQLTGISFGEFFRLLRMFFTQPEEYVKIKGKGQDPIIKIIRTISPESIQANQPFVRFPGAGSFTAMPITEKTKTLTQTIVRAHEIEKKPIDFSDEDIDVLIINTARINVPLKLGKRKATGHTALVTPSPKEFLPSYEALYVFNEINWQDTVQSLLFNLSYLNARMYTQTFVINTLSGILAPQSGLQGSGSSISNFIMQMRGVAGNNFMAPEQPSMQLNTLIPQMVKTGQVGMNIQIAFEFNENIYQCMFAIRNIEKPEELSANIQRLTFTATPKKSINMNTLASNFLTQQEIAQLRKPITMESISELINDKIDKQDPSMAIWSEADTDDLLKYVKQHRRKK